MFASVNGGIETGETKTEDEEDNIVLITRNGRIKQSSLALFTTYRSYKSKTAVAMILKEENDERDEI